MKISHVGAMCLLVAGVSTVQGQRLRPDWGGVVGFSNYLGDIGNGTADGRPFISDVQPQETRMTVGVHAIYNMDRVWAVRGGLQFVGIAGDDAHTNAGPRRARNLHFRNNLIEASARAEGYWRPNQSVLSGTGVPTMYGFVGLAGFYSNPQAREINAGPSVVGVWHNLRPERTEGVAYSPFGIAIPWGLGAQWQVSGGWQIGTELCYRFTFTDYLDDISNSYAEGTYSSRATEESVASAGEGAGLLSDHTYNPLAPNRRGNPENNDSYFSIQLTFSKATPRGRNGTSWTKRPGEHPARWDNPPRR